MSIKRFSSFLNIAVTTALGFSASIGLVLVPTAPAQAQAEFSNLLEEIVVTARRREESLKDVPVAISVLDGGFLQDANILDSYDLYAETPGIQYEESRDRQGTSPSIRGVNTTSQNVLNQKMGFFVDGAPIVGNLATYGLSELERIEVLRGPQSSAFGRSTFSGAINFVTRDPGNEFNTKLKVTQSNQNRSILGAHLDGPITDTLGFTLDIVRDRFDGPDEWVGSDGYRLGFQNSDLISGKLKFTPSDFFDMEITASYSEHNDGTSNEGYPSKATRDACVNTTLPNGDPYLDGVFDCRADIFPLQRNHNLTGYFTEGSDDYWTAMSLSILDPILDGERSRIQGQFNFNMDSGSVLQLITSYHDEYYVRHHDADMTSTLPKVKKGKIGMGQVNNMGREAERDETYLDVRWLSPDDSSFRWLVGLSQFGFTHEDATYNQLLTRLRPDLEIEKHANDGVPYSPARRMFQITTNTGLYGNITYDLSDQTTVSLEARFQRDEIITKEVVAGTLINQVTDSFQPRLAINHAMNDDWSLFGQLSQGTNPATSTPQFADLLIIASLQGAQDAGFVSYNADTWVSTKEEKLSNIEFGIKGNGLDGRLQLAASIYAMDWTNMILGQDFDWAGAVADDVTGCAGIPNCWNDGTYHPDGVTIFEETDAMAAINRGNGDLRGIEVEANWLATDNLSLRGTLSLMDNTYSKNCDQEPVEDFGYTPTLTVADDGVNADCFDITGNRIENSANKMFTLAATYREELINGWDWMARVSMRHQGDQYMDVVNLCQMPAWTTLTGTMSFSNDNWEVILFGNNFSNEDAPLQLTCANRDRSLSNPQGNFRVKPRIPREIGLRLNYSF
jgi:iron complex outermembrane receptor protein